MIDPAKLVGVRVDVDQRLVRVVRRDQLVAVGGGLTQSRLDHQQQVGLADALLQLGVGAVAELAGVNSACVGDRVLSAEGRGGGGCHDERRNWRNDARQAETSRRHR